VRHHLSIAFLASLAFACAHAAPGGPSTTAANAAPVPTVATASPVADVLPTADDASRALSLAGVRNARDLGGLVGVHGPIPPGRFLRAATLAHATEGDKQALLRHGVTLDIDLRTALEIEQSRDTLADDPRFHYEHISLLGTGLLDWLRHSRLDEAYTEVLAHHQGELREIFHSLAAHQDGAVLFHCAAGKDRTGIVAAILLSLAGVDHEAIVHDYAISSHYLRESTTEQDGATSSPPGTMARFLDTLDRQYGGARAYLVKIGLSETEVDALSRRLGQ
jgi:protein-tyrosine phosphatase